MTDMNAGSRFLCQLQHHVRRHKLRHRGMAIQKIPYRCFTQAARLGFKSLHQIVILTMNTYKRVYSRGLHHSLVKGGGCCVGEIIPRKAGKGFKGNRTRRLNQLHLRRVIRYEARPEGVIDNGFLSCSRLL